MTARETARAPDNPPSRSALAAARRSRLPSCRRLVPRPGRRQATRDGLCGPFDSGRRDVTFELALVPEAALVIEPGESNIERCRMLHQARKLVDLEFALRVKAEIDGPGSKTQQQIADEIGCSQKSVSRALELLGETRERTKIANKSGGLNDDLDSIDRHFERVKSMEFDDPEDADDECFETGAEQPAQSPPEDIVDAELIEEESYEAPEPAWSDDERDLLKRLQDGETVVISMRDTGHPWLYRWAEQEGLFVRIDRRSDWGNPFEMPADGDRARVIANYAHHYLPFKPSLLSRLSELRGKALGCWCAPEPCHGDVLKARADE